MKRSPLLITLAGTAVLGTLGVRRLALVDSGEGRLLGALAFALYLGWLGWESRVSVAELDKEEARGDAHTMELCAAAKCLTLLAAWAGGGTIAAAPALGGIALLLAGIALRGWAVRHLGRAYSHRIRPPAPLRQDGPYRVLRHPAYAGTLLAHTGLVLVFQNTWSVAALLALWYPAVLLRTVLEDRYLGALPAYGRYTARVRFRLVPGVW